MGQSSSKRKKNKTAGGIPSHCIKQICDCALYHRTKHCCRNQCFPLIKNVESFCYIPPTYGMRSDEWIFSDLHEKSLINSLSIFSNDVDLKEFISIILLYLHVSLNMNAFRVYCHGEITKSIETTKSTRLCQVWTGKKDKPHNREFKITVLGHLNAGKSALVDRFVTNNFLDEYDPTIEDSYRKQIIVDDNAILLDILDTAGQEEFSSMQDRYLRETQICMIVFAIDCKEAIEECIMIWEKYLRIQDLSWIGNNDHDCRASAILVAAKCDLRYEKSNNFDEEKHKIMEQNYKNAMKLSKAWNIPLIETSAKQNINVHLLFKQLVYEYWIQTQTRSINWDATADY